MAIDLQQQRGYCFLLLTIFRSTLTVRATTTPQVRKKHQAKIVLNRERLRSQDMTRDIWGRHVRDFVEQKLYTVDDARDLIRVSIHCSERGVGYQRQRNT